MKKMRFKKRIYAFVLMLAMVITMLPVSRLAVKAEDAGETSETFGVHVLVDSQLGWAEPNIHFWGSESSDWPGNALGESVGDFTTDGTNEYALYETELKNGVTGIIINASGKQTADIKDFECKEMWIVVSKDGDGNKAEVKYADPRVKVVYANVPADYEEVAIHFWGDKPGTSSDWPGVKIEKNEDGYYEAVVPFGANGFLIDNNKAQGGIQTEDGSFCGNFTYAEVTIQDNHDAIRTEDYDFMKYNRVYVRAKSMSSIFYHAWGGEGVQGTSWPGVELTGADESGWYSLLLKKEYTGFMFTNGDAENTAKSNDINVADILAEGNVYFEVASDFKFEATATKPVDGLTVFFKGLPENFGTPYIHYWNDESYTTWPGIEVTETNDKGYYVVEVPVGTKYFIVNNNNGSQTADIEIVGDKNYYIYGDKTATAYNPDDFMTVHIKTEYEETAVYEFEGYEVKGWPGTVLADADEDGWYTVLLDIRSSKFIVNNNNKGSQTANLIRADYAEKTWIYVNEDNEVAAFATKDAAEDAIEAAKAPADPSQPVEKTTFTVHVKAPSDWEKVQAYICTSSWGHITGDWDNATEMSKGADGWYTIEVKIKKAPYYYIFHNGDGSQTANLVYAGTEDVWFDITKKGDDGQYIGTPLNKNPDELSEAEKAEAEKQAAEEAKRREEEEKRKQEAAMKEQLKDSYIVYVQVPSSWTNACYYTWVKEPFEDLAKWPGTTLKDKDGSWYKAYVPKKMNQIIFNDGKAEGATQTADITISGTEYFIVNEAGKFERFTKKPSTQEIQKAEEAAANKLKDTYNVYVKVDASWTDACYYAWVKEPFEDLAKWPGTKLPTEMKDGYHVVKVPKFMDWIIINNGKADGAVQTKDIETKGKDCYITVNADGSYEVIDASGNKIDGEEPAKVVEGVEKVTLYVKAPADWATPRLWAWGSEGNLYDAWPGEALVKEGDWLVATLPTWVNYLIINGNDGAVQTPDIKLAEIGKDIFLTVISADEYTIEFKDVVAHEEVKPETTTPSGDDSKDEDKKDDEKKDTETIETGANNEASTEESGSALSPQTIMLIITAAVILIGGVIVIVVLSKKKAFDPKE